MSVVTTGRDATGRPTGTTAETSQRAPDEASSAALLPPEQLPGERPTEEPSTGEPAGDPPHRNGRTPGPVPRDNVVPPAALQDRSAGTRVLVGPRPRRRLGFLRGLGLTFLAIVLVGAGAVAGREVADRMPTMYAAHADVLYPLVGEQPTGFLRQDRNLSTQQVLLASRTVLDPVAVQFGIPAEDLADELETEVVDESEIIRIQFTDTSRAQARKVLVAILARYLEVANPQRATVRAYLDAQLADVQARLAEERESTDETNQGEIVALMQREAALQSQIDEDQFSAIAGSAPQITVPPYVEHEAVSPQPLLVTGGGALAGLVVALIVVAALARRMTRL